MNVSSLELSKRLEELSGWTDTTWFHFKGLLQTSHELRGRTMSVDDRAVPAYDAGCLLRKLFESGFTWVKGVTEEESGVEDRRPFWKAGWNVTGHHVEAAGTDTPEDALCLLTIKLFEQGVLTKEGEL